MKIKTFGKKSCINCHILLGRENVQSFNTHCLNLVFSIICICRTPFWSLCTTENNPTHPKQKFLGFLTVKSMWFFFSSDMPFSSFLSIKFTCKDVYSLSRCVSTVFWLKAALISCRPMIFNFFFSEAFC